MELSRDPEIDLYKYSQLTLTKEQNQCNGAKTVFSTNSARTTGYTHTHTHTHKNQNKPYILHPRDDLVSHQKNLYWALLSKSGQSKIARFQLYVIPTLHVSLCLCVCCNWFFNSPSYFWVSKRVGYAMYNLLFLDVDLQRKPNERGFISYPTWLEGLQPIKGLD